MRKVAAVSVVALALAVSACGGSTTVSKTVTAPAVTQTQTAPAVTQTQTAPPQATTPGVSPSQALIIATIRAKSPSLIPRFCAARSTELNAGISDATIEAAFARGYDQTAGVGAPSAQTVYNAIVTQCTPSV